METPIIVAIISGSVALVSPILTLVIKGWIENRDKEQIEGRRKAIVGTWRGSFVQDFDGTLMSTDLEVTFTAGRKILQGEIKYTHPLVNSLTKLNFTGSFHHEHYVKVDYTNPKVAVVQFGSIIMKLSADGKMLKGKFVGYGSYTDLIVSGEVVLLKQFDD